MAPDPDNPTAAALAARVTRKVTFTVDTPAGVTDGELAEYFAGIEADGPVTPGWWVSYPEVAGGGGSDGT